MMSEANNSTCNTAAYAIGSTINGTELIINKDPSAQPPTDCQPYSGQGSDYIEATTIQEGTKTGVQIKYSGGECESGEPATFRIKAWCNPDISVTDTEYGGEIQN